MCEWAAQERDLQHAGQADVGDEFATAAQKAIIFLAQQRFAQALAGNRRVLQRHDYINA